MNKIIAANWKMYGNNNFVSDYFEFFIKNLKNNCNNEIIIFPSYLHLDKANIFKKNIIFLNLVHKAVILII